MCGSILIVLVLLLTGSVVHLMMELAALQDTTQTAIAQQLAEIGVLSTNLVQVTENKVEIARLSAQLDQLTASTASATLQQTLDTQVLST